MSAPLQMPIENRSNPLLKVPPACRGNRVWSGRFPSRSGGNLQEGGNHELWLGDWYNRSSRHDFDRR